MHEQIIMTLRFLRKCAKGTVSTDYYSVNLSEWPSEDSIKVNTTF